MLFFDTHCHLDDAQFDADRDGVVTRAQKAGVKTLIAVGTTAMSSETCQQLADRYDGVYAAVGIHPNYCAEATAIHWQSVVDLVENQRVVAVGETGLDRHWDYTPWDAQRDYFERHLRLSQDHQLPFIVHMRDCADDVMVMLREAHARGPLRGVMHSFTGDVATAAECVELGLHVSFSGIVTYKKSASLREVAAQIPDTRLLIETDAPYLSPHPKRGKRPNEPALLVHIAQCLAEIRDTPVEHVAALTAGNACRLFGLSP